MGRIRKGERDMLDFPHIERVEVRKCTGTGS